MDNPAFIKAYLKLSKPTKKQKEDFAKQLYEHCTKVYQAGKDWGRMELRSEFKALLNIHN